jgi:hypothetical protein
MRENLELIRSGYPQKEACHDLVEFDDDGLGMEDRRSL